MEMTLLRVRSLKACLLGLIVLSAALLSACKTVESESTFRYGVLQVTVSGSSSAASAERPMPEDFQIREKSWLHEWRCRSYDDVCRTDFSTTLYVFDKRTGKQLKWNRVEVFLADHCLASADDRERYRTVADTDVVSLGWGKDREGKYDKISAFLVFYADWGSVNARVRALACP
jgi:hypothetical protein